MTTSYASLDAEIVKAIRDGRRTFSEIRYSDVYKAAEAVTKPGAEPWRTIDRRLQSLRKRGIIKYNNGRWSAVESV
jgi:hypothetical protein